MSTYPPSPALIAVDWGTTNFRAFLLDTHGKCLANHFARKGLLHVPKQDFLGVLKQQIQYLSNNIPQGLPVIMSGMVGSRRGWKEVPYLHCPLDLNDLANHLEPVPNAQNIWIVPGVRMDYPDGHVEIMRGEEVQILGGFTVNHTSNLFCLPGTHSKWAFLESGKLIRFKTLMTGELFNLLSKHSILNKSQDREGFYTYAFCEGIAWGKRHESLLSQLFQVRSQMIAGKLSEKEQSSFLSGLLIAHEIEAMLPGMAMDNDRAITIVSNKQVGRLYTKGLLEYGFKPHWIDANQASTKALFHLASKAGIL